MSEVAPVLGLLIGVCVIALVLEFAGRPLRWSRPRHRQSRVTLAPAVRRALLAGVVGGVLTRWPVAIVGIAGMTYLLGEVLSARTRAKDDIIRTRAIARWVASLRNSVRPGNPLAPSIEATARTADAPIRREVQEFARSWQTGDFDGALNRLAVDLDHHMGDLLVTTLRAAHAKGPRRLGEVLDSVARAAEEEAKMMEVIEADRGSVNTEIRIVTAILGITFIALSFTTYGDSYRSVEGQLMLTLVLTIFVGTLAWMGSLTRYNKPDRFLTVSEYTMDGAR